jgi:hypothetical protein
MSEKNYTPVEAARKVLEKCQEIYDMHKAEMDKCGEMSKEEGMSVEEAVSAIMGEKHGVDDVMSKLPKEKRAKVLASLRSKDAKKAEFCKGWMEKAEEMDKCGEMSKGHDEAKESPAQEAKESSAVQAQEEKQDKEMHPKLKSFIEKRKAKKAAKMEKMMGIGEKAPVAAPAQSAAPVNAPKPALPKVGGAMGKSEKKK